MIRIRITLLLMKFLLFLPRKLMKGIELSKLIIRLKTVLSLPIDASSPELLLFRFLPSPSRDRTYETEASLPN